MEREVQDSEKVTWKCVQAFTGTAGESARQAVNKTTAVNGMVSVICTPSGGSQTVRLEMDADWFTRLSDQELVDAINAVNDKS